MGTSTVWNNETSLNVRSALGSPHAAGGAPLESELPSSLDPTVAPDVLLELSAAVVSPLVVASVVEHASVSQSSSVPSLPGQPRARREPTVLGWRPTPYICPGNGRLRPHSSENFPRRRTRLVWLAAVVAVLAAVLAGSPGTELELQWDAPPECPQEQAVREAIDSNLGQEAFSSALSSV